MALTLSRPAALAAASSRPRRRDWHAFTAHAILLASVVVLAFPLYYAFVISTQTLSQVTTMPPKPWPSTAIVANYAEAWQRAHMGRMLVNSAIVALGVAVGKIAISLLSAFAIVYFDFRGKNLVFWMIFVTLMLPVPVRIVSTYQVVSVLETHPDIALVQVEGHTDSVGSERLNTALSQARAESVVAYLVAHGVASSRLVARGFGPSRPLASNATRTGREANRRVEFRVLERRQSLDVQPATPN